MDQTILIQMATTVVPTAPPASPEALPVDLARALGDPLRWRIVELLSTEQLCVAHLAEELAPRSRWSATTSRCSARPG
jgi:hypothetical protein